MVHILSTNLDIGLLGRFSETIYAYPFVFFQMLCDFALVLADLGSRMKREYQRFPNWENIRLQKLDCQYFS